MARNHFGFLVLRREQPVDVDFRSDALVNLHFAANPNISWALVQAAVCIEEDSSAMNLSAHTDIICWKMG